MRRCCGSPLQQLTNSLNQPLLGQGFDQERISAGVARAPMCGENAEYQHDGVGEFRVLLHRPAQRQAIQLGDHDLGDDDRGPPLTCELQRGDTVLGKVHREAGFVQKKGLEITHVRVAFDNKDQRTCFVCIHGFAITARPDNGVEAEAHMPHTQDHEKDRPVHDRDEPVNPAFARRREQS